MGCAYSENDFPARSRPPPSETFHPVEAKPIENKAHATRAFYPPGYRLSQSEFIAERFHPRGTAGLDQFEIVTRHLSEPADKRRIDGAEKIRMMTWYRPP